MEGAKAFVKVSIRKGPGRKGKGNVERLLSVIIKIYTPVCTTYVSS